MTEKLNSVEIALAWQSGRGTVKNLVVGPPGAVYAAEGIKNAEKNSRDPNYVPSWNPGKVASKEATTDDDLTEVLKNPLLSDEVREWLTK